MPQDLPPLGGYDPVQYKVRIELRCRIQCPTVVTATWCSAAKYLPEQVANHVHEQRNLPARGFRPVYYLVAVGAIMSYGFYKVGKGIREQKYAPKPPHVSLQFRIHIGDYKRWRLTLYVQ